MAAGALFKGLGRRKYFDPHVDLGHTLMRNNMIEYYISPNYVKLFNDPPKVVISRFIRRCMIVSPYVVLFLATYGVVKFCQYGIYYNRTKHYNIMGIPMNE